MVFSCMARAVAKSALPRPGALCVSFFRSRRARRCSRSGQVSAFPTACTSPAMGRMQGLGHRFDRVPLPLPVFRCPLHPHDDPHDPVFRGRERSRQRSGASGRAWSVDGMGQVMIKAGCQRLLSRRSRRQEFDGRGRGGARWRTAGGAKLPTSSVGARGAGRRPLRPHFEGAARHWPLPGGSWRGSRDGSRTGAYVEAPSSGRLCSCG